MLMKKMILIPCLTFFICGLLQAQKLAFNEQGSFKIVQLTDMHYLHGNTVSDTTLLLLNRVLDTEKPDLVLFTGDIVTGPVQEGWDAVTAPVIKRNIPFAVTLGNHDHEHGVTRGMIAEIVTGYPMNVNSLSAVSDDRVLDNVIPVYEGTRSLKEAALIYCFDSGAYSTIGDLEGYGWITDEQIDWYRDQSMGYTRKHNFVPLPALAFFHIPLPEYRTAFDDDQWIRFGVRKEKECAPELNSGMLLAMREMRDVMATFTGHDHVNNYIVDYHGIALAYGAFSGWKTTYTPEINGARVILLKKGSREFDTWLHMLDGNILYRVTYPVDFGLKK